MPQPTQDSTIVDMAKEICLCYMDGKHPPEFHEEYLDQAVKTIRNEHPGRNWVFWTACKNVARPRVKGALRKERAGVEKKEAAKKAPPPPPQPKKRHLQPSKDTLSGSLFETV